MRPAPDPEHNDERDGERGTGGNLQMHGEIFHGDDDLVRGKTKLVGSQKKSVGGKTNLIRGEKVVRGQQIW